MSVEGKLSIELMCRDNRIHQVRILSSRPLQLPLLFEGKPVVEVLKTLPLLYSICATAQARAAAIACRQALGVVCDPRVERAESMLVWFENAREHLWRVLIDWPGYLGEEVERQHLPALSQTIPAARQALFGEAAGAFTLHPVLAPDREALSAQIERLSGTLETAVFGMPVLEWFALDSVPALEQWIERRATGAARYLARLMSDGADRLGQTGVGALPEIDEVDLHQRLRQPDAEDFVAAPQWRDQPCETSALTRQLTHPLVDELLRRYGNGLLTRLVARLVELASIPARLNDCAQGLDSEVTAAPASLPATGRGLGVVEAARGRLVHRVSVSGNLIDRYQILAPTEWNFHPRGLVAEGLLGLPCGYESTMRQQASLFISAVDPCVGYSFEFV